MYTNKVKKIAAVHDLSGAGRVSLTVVIPILSSMGFQVCPLPTAVLSSHTQYPHFSFLDLTDEMPKIISEWKQLGVQFDAIYTGYLGSPRQIQIVSGFIDDFRQSDSLVMIDPVLGDNGKLYTNFDEQMILEMRHLIRKADVITPNMTELFYLLDKPYKAENTDEELKAYLHEISEHGPGIVIITSVPVQGDPRKTSVYAYDRQGKPLLESNVSLPARTLSRHRRYIYQCDNRLTDTRRQSSYRLGPRHTVYPSRHPRHFRL